MDDSRSTVAIVTGASRGIGRAIAITLARRMRALTLVGRDEKSLHSTAVECGKTGCEVVEIRQDLSQLEKTADIVEQTAARFGGLDCLINNAGAYDHAPVGEADLEVWDKIIDVNLRAPIHLTHHSAKYLKESDNQPCIINIASIAATMTYGGGAIYCATKHALRGFSGCAFEDLRSSGVKVTTILPGYVATDMSESDRLISSKMIQPEDIAECVNYVLDVAPTACPTEIVLRPQESPYKA